MASRCTTISRYGPLGAVWAVSLAAPTIPVALPQSAYRLGLSQSQASCLWSSACPVQLSLVHLLARQQLVSS